MLPCQPDHMPLVYGRCVLAEPVKNEGKMGRMESREQSKRRWRGAEHFVDGGVPQLGIHAVSSGCVEEPEVCDDRCRSIYYQHEPV